MDQVLQLAGALLVLAGFTLLQFRLLHPRSVGYLLMNAAGSSVLAVLALLDHQWGFLLLEGVWAVVSFGGLLHLARAPGPVRAT